MWPCVLVCLYNCLPGDSCGTLRCVPLLAPSTNAGVTASMFRACLCSFRVLLISHIHTWPLGFSPCAAVTNHHKSKTPENNTSLLSYSSGGQKAKMGLAGLKSGVGRMDPSWSLQGRVYSLSVPTSRNHLHSLAGGHITPTSASITTSPFPTLTSCLLLRRILVIMWGLPGSPESYLYFKTFNLSTPAKSLLPYKAIFTGSRD